MKRLFSFIMCLLPLVSEAQSPQVSPEVHEAFPYEEVSIGSDKAPVTIIEYSAFTCGHCADFHKNVFPRLKEKYIDKGKVRFIFRHFPMDAYALKISSVIRQMPVSRQWQTVNAVYDRQETWLKGDFVKEIAHLCNLPEEQCKVFMENKNHLNHLAQQLIHAHKVHKVNATPTFFVNGTKIESALTYEQFDKILKALT